MRTAFCDFITEERKNLEYDIKNKRRYLLCG